MISVFKPRLVDRTHRERRHSACSSASKPVPERWNVKSLFIETPDGQRLAGRVGSDYEGRRKQNETLSGRV